MVWRLQQPVNAGIILFKNTATLGKAGLNTYLAHLQPTASDGHVVFALTVFLKNTAN